MTIAARLLGLGLGLVACGQPTQGPQAGVEQQSEAAAKAKTGDAPPASATPAPSLDLASLPGTIHFISERDGNLEVYRWRADAAAERLTDDPRADFVADVAVDGTGWTRVATLDGAAPEDHREQLLWMPAQGEPVAIGAQGRRARGASWAADRSFVVFESDADGAFSDLWRWEPGGVATRLTETEHGAFEPAVSPDGTTIAFVSTRDGNPELYVMEADGKAMRRLTTWRRDDRRPRWSPDGRRLAFLRREQGGERLFVLDVPTAGDPIEHRVLPTADGERVKHADHEWSPDGTHLVFTVHRPEQDPELTVADLKGNARVVSPPHLRATMPSWSPDGRHLAFTGTTGDPSALDLYVVAVEGGAWVQLTTAAAPDWLPRWSS